jgi:phosphosulfolactate synthase
MGLIDEIVHAISAERLLFEAPQRAQQVWFLKQFGLDVNLGNIPPDDVLSLETLRRGLRSDTAERALPPDMNGRSGASASERAEE